MSANPEPARNIQMFFTKDHEWIKVDGDVATVGISAYAAEQLGDVVFVEVPDLGKVLTVGDSLAVVESVKAASDVYAPVSGEVIEANGDLAASPETVNADPEGAGWFAKLKIADPGQLEGLMNRAAYDAFLASL
jgi:glycine cleavage system H protein